VESPDDMRKIHFDISSKHVGFRLCKFVLTTGLNFRKYPEISKLKTMSRSKRLMKKYMNNLKIVRSGELKAAFLNSEDIKDAWKLELCYLVDSLLLVGEFTKKIDLDITFYVENEKEYFQFP
ncbi:hypothetical protein PanWU01x14_265510, partial [Parasponia andersonii]